MFFLKWRKHRQLLFRKLFNNSDSETEFHGFELEYVKDESDVDLNLVVIDDKLMKLMLDDDMSVSSVSSIKNQ